MKNDKSGSMIILAGGHSSRMGQDKADLWLQFRCLCSAKCFALQNPRSLARKCMKCTFCASRNGLRSRYVNSNDLCFGKKTFLEIQIDKGSALGIEDVIVSGYRGTRCRLPVIPDRFSEKGPLSGMETCLRRAKGTFCLVLSVDVPLVPVSELRNLIAAYQSSDKKAVILKTGVQEQPLIGVYHTSLADEMLEEIENRKGSVFAFLRRITYDVYESKADPELFMNINDLQTYQKLRYKSYADCLYSAKKL